MFLSCHHPSNYLSILQYSSLSISLSGFFLSFSGCLRLSLSLSIYISVFLSFLLPACLHVCLRLSVSRAPARAADAAVISDKYTFLRGKCKSFPRKIVSCGCWREHWYLYLSVVCHLRLLSINFNQFQSISINVSINILDDSIYDGLFTVIIL